MDTGGAGLALRMMELGFTNVKVVHSFQKDMSGGEAMEKVFEYVWDGRIINPMTAKKY